MKVPDDITESQKKVLLGVLYRCKRDSQYGTQPSKEDLDYLDEKYKGIHRATAMTSFTLHFHMANSNSTARFVGPSVRFFTN